MFINSKLLLPCFHAKCDFGVLYKHMRTSNMPYSWNVLLSVFYDGDISHVQAACQISVKASPESYCTVLVMSERDLRMCLV